MASLILGAPPVSSPSLLPLSSRISSSQSQILGHSLCTSSPLPVSISSNATPLIPLVYCGRGDRKTAKGKRFNHSFGNARPKDKKKGRGPPRVPVAPSPSKKERVEDNDIVKIEIDESLFSN